MNFLAHIYLSGDNPQLRIGNFMADHVKGSAINQLPDEIYNGVKLHRLIDQYTDQHPVVMLSKKRLRPEFHKYAPVITDVFYDHFLARDWEKYHDESLNLFTRKFYNSAETFEKFLPERTRRMLFYMKADNWLLSYSKIEGIHQALCGMARRTTFDSSMEIASFALEKNYTEFENEFSLFFEELRMYVNSYLENLSMSAR
jgi:acyl carrier protein phosphodiesterase